MVTGEKFGSVIWEVALSPRQKVPASHQSQGWGLEKYFTSPPPVIRIGGFFFFLFLLGGRGTYVCVLGYAMQYCISTKLTQDLVIGFIVISSA